MHEMSLVESVREIVEETARANGARRVALVRLEIGVLAQVEPEALRFAFDVVMRGSLAETARLEMVATPGTAWCMACSQAVEIAARGDPCPRCESWQLQVSGGDRMRVLDIEIE
ncbi:protein involved with the maturation of hydrogenases 1 and 2 [Rubrivivax sp. A210]|uniref:hydrogenase maturation nickel metallochaperone HypA n=1 Tax=Rubrivivax sp. A210 TaxID=2772301 RepID=UPI00191A09C5|nr:hydrogenase maturation nickel metallochaperone HypA [Rubrivivax sp. A210]CAD5375025.1 protein involved with the maturation of hydrogenases 1 and 2 [Rubrivivax sp. A210]